MVANLLRRPLVPVANADDAGATYEAFRPYLQAGGGSPIVVHVIEKAGGAPDKASVEQRKEFALEAFEKFRNLARTDDIDVETEIRYGTDVAEAIHDAAEEHDASAIVFRSRGGNRWLDLLSGNVRAKLMKDHDRPVIVLPESRTQRGTE